jgi:hypothetical protein
MTPERRDGSDGAEPLALALQRARADFLEMPGLRLTAAQARRLWMLDSGLCEAVLTELVGSQFLARSGGDSFVRADSSMRRSP